MSTNAMNYSTYSPINSTRLSSNLFSTLVIAFFQTINSGHFGSYPFSSHTHKLSPVIWHSPPLPIETLSSLSDSYNTHFLPYLRCYLHFKFVVLILSFIHWSVLYCLLPLSSCYYYPLAAYSLLFKEQNPPPTLFWLSCHNTYSMGTHSPPCTSSHSKSPPNSHWPLLL